MKKGMIGCRVGGRGTLALLVLCSSLALSQERPRILLSNDDGYRDPGIKVLVTKLTPLADIVVAAPAANQSGVAHSTTFKEPIPVESWKEGPVQWHAVSAAPATCVRLAIASLMDRPPEIVVAGINRGENVGMVTFSSGTVACAREAAFQGVPAVCVNLERGEVMDYDAAADFVVSLVRDVQERGLPPRTFLNVNYPAVAKGQVRGVLVTRLDTRPPDERYEKIVSPQGKITYRSIWEPLRTGDPETDTWALSQGYISVTPLHIDQTLAATVENLRAWKCLKSSPAPTKKASGQ